MSLCSATFDVEPGVGRSSTASHGANWEVITTVNCQSLWHSCESTSLKTDWAHKLVCR